MFSSKSSTRSLQPSFKLRTARWNRQVSDLASHERRTQRRRLGGCLGILGVDGQLVHLWWMNGDLMGFNGDSMGFNGVLLGSNSDLMRFNGDLLVIWSDLMVIWSDLMVI